VRRDENTARDIRISKWKLPSLRVGKLPRVRISCKKAAPVTKKQGGGGQTPMLLRRRFCAIHVSERFVTENIGNWAKSANGAGVFVSLLCKFGRRPIAELWQIIGAWRHAGVGCLASSI